MKSLYYLAVLVVLSCFLCQSSAQTCIKMEGGCAPEKCINNICEECVAAGKSVANECKCTDKQFLITADDGSYTCKDCDDNCLTCAWDTEKNEEVCTSCHKLDGWKLNHLEGECQCVPTKYKSNLVKPGPGVDVCRRCFTYGTKCEDKCPDGMIEDKTYWQCQKETDEDLENDDDILYIIVTICLVILIIVLTSFLYYYFYKIFKKILTQDTNKIVPVDAVKIPQDSNREMTQNQGENVISQIDEEKHTVKKSQANDREANDMLNEINEILSQKSQSQI